MQVVDLDGVVDGDAARALAGNRLSDYMHQRGVTHFADWPFNYFVLLSRSEAARVGTSELHPIGAASPQGGDRFRIARSPIPPRL